MRCIYIKDLMELLEKKKGDEFIVDHEFEDMCTHEVYLNRQNIMEYTEPRPINKRDK